MVHWKVFLRNKIVYSKDSLGFTVIELIMVMAIVAVMSAAVYPVFDGLMNKIVLEHAAYRIAGDIRYIKAKSVASEGTNLPVIEIVSKDRVANTGNYYRVKYGTTTSESVYLDDIYSSRVDILGYSGAENEISFGQLGTPLKCGTVTLKNDNGELMYVIVSPVIGRIRVNKNPPPSWEDKKFKLLR